VKAILQKYCETQVRRNDNKKQNEGPVSDGNEKGRNYSSFNLKWFILKTSSKSKYKRGILREEKEK
jgi:hypothetical protein